MPDMEIRDSSLESRGFQLMEPLKFVTLMVASHISEIAHLPVFALSFHSLIDIPSIVRNRLAILVYAYLVLKASLLIKAAFRRSRIVNIDG
jgi:hypothetical protein